MGRSTISHGVPTLPECAIFVRHRQRLRKGTIPSYITPSKSRQGSLPLALAEVYLRGIANVLEVAAHVRWGFPDATGMAGNRTLQVVHVLRWKASLNVALQITIEILD